MGNPFIFTHTHIFCERKIEVEFSSDLKQHFTIYAKIKFFVFRMILFPAFYFTVADKR